MTPGRAIPRSDHLLKATHGSCGEFGGIIQAASIAWINCGEGEGREKGRGEGREGERGRSGEVLGKGVLLKTLLCSWLSSVADCTLINGWNGGGGG